MALGAAASAIPHHVAGVRRRADGAPLVMMFVLTIFTVVQFVLRDTITGQETELAELSAEVTSLAQALGLEQQTVANLEDSARG